METLLPNEIWLNILEYCDPITYIRMFLVSKSIPKCTFQYERMRQKYYTLKYEIHIESPEKQNGHMVSQLIDGFGNPITYKMKLPLLKLPFLKEHPANIIQPQKYQIDLRRPLDSRYDKFKEMMTNIDSYIGECINTNRNTNNNSHNSQKGK
jgi:hypothetical protein